MHVRYFDLGKFVNCAINIFPLSAGIQQDRFGLAIGADVAQGAPGDALEYIATAGRAAYISGRDPDQLVAIAGTFPFTTDTPDFWRREGMPYPEHGGRFG